MLMSVHSRRLIITNHFPFVPVPDCSMLNNVDGVLWIAYKSCSQAAIFSKSRLWIKCGNTTLSTAIIVWQQSQPEPDTIISQPCSHPHPVRLAESLGTDTQSVVSAWRKDANENIKLIYNKRTNNQRMEDDGGGDEGGKDNHCSAPS